MIWITCETIFLKITKHWLTIISRKSMAKKLASAAPLLPTNQKGGVQVIHGKEVVFYFGKVRFNVMDRKAQDFGFHRSST